ncbi:Gluconolactonase precursor [compost metagenome]
MDAVVKDIPNPNGLCFSPDERLLYIVDNGSRPNRILVYEVGEDGTLAHGRTFVDAGDQGLPDGIRCDTDGNVWAGWGSGPALNGVMVFAPDGAPIGRIALPDRCANLCFGGARRNRLFMVAGQCLFSLYVDAQGAARP